MPPRKKLDDPRVDRLLEGLWDLGATDLILTVGAPPLMRLNGDLQPVLDSCVDADLASRLAALEG